MSLIVNGTEIKHVFKNGSKVGTVSYKGVIVLTNKLQVIIRLDGDKIIEYQTPPGYYYHFAHFRLGVEIPNQEFYNKSISLPVTANYIQRYKPHPTGDIIQYDSREDLGNATMGNTVYTHTITSYYASNSSSGWDMSYFDGCGFYKVNINGVDYDLPSIVNSLVETSTIQTVQTVDKFLTF